MKFIYCGNGYLLAILLAMFFRWRFLASAASASLHLSRAACLPALRFALLATGKAHFCFLVRRKFYGLADSQRRRSAEGGAGGGAAEAEGTRLRQAALAMAFGQQNESSKGGNK